MRPAALTWLVAMGIGASPALGPGALSAQTPAGALVLTHARIVDPAGAGTIREGSVVVKDGKIASLEPADAATPEHGVMIDLGGRYLLAGLIDAHVHIRSLGAARRALASGVTTARSAGVSHFVDVGLRELARAGRIEAPELLATGYHIRPRPSEDLFLDHPELGDLIGTDVHGAETIRRLVNVMLAHGVDFVKVNATARAGLPETDPREPYYDEEELRVLVRTAEAAGVPVMAHAHGDKGARAAVLAGVRSIEHGTYLSDETLDLMVQRGTYLAPTIAVVTDLTIPGGDYDNAFLQIRGRHMLPRVRDTAGRAYRKGVKIVAATDTGYGPESTVRLGHELAELVGVGLSPAEVLRAAGSVAAELLGVGDHTGRIEPGLDADLIVVDRNPLEDIRAVQDVLLVVNDGKVVVNRLDW
ncbi:MAG: amidohydrolase family protein [Gemmatimonadota bacterium]